MKHLADENGIVCLQKFTGLQVTPSDADMDDVAVCACIDVETTGLSVVSDKVIEIGIQVVAFNKKSGEIVEMLDSYESLNDPGCPIPQEASATNGIYDSHVKGHHIDWFKVKEICESVDFCVAFNAGFDCKFVFAGCKGATGQGPKALWVCALNQVKWSDVPARKLEVLAAWNGYWYDAHRALIDVQMTLQLLELNGHLVKLHELHNKPTYEVQVSGGPRDEASLAKLKTQERRFEWDRTRTLWWRSVPSKQEAIDLVRYLDKYYDGRNMSAVKEVPPGQQFGITERIEYSQDLRKVWGV